MLDLPVSKFGIKSVSIVELPQTGKNVTENDSVIPEILKALEDSLENDDESKKHVEKRATTAHLRAVGAAAAPALFNKHNKGKCCLLSFVLLLQISCYDFFFLQNTSTETSAKSVCQVWVV